MKHRAIEQVLQRAADAKTDSDFSYFFALLLAGEMLAKTVTLGVIAAIRDDKDRNHYRLEHLLVKADGLGDWSKALEDGTPLEGLPHNICLPKHIVSRTS